MVNIKKKSIFKQNSYIELAKLLNEKIEKGSYLNEIYEAKYVIDRFFKEPVSVNCKNPRELSIQFLVEGFNFKNKILKSEMVGVKLVLNFRIARIDQKISFCFLNEEIAFTYRSYNFDKSKKSIKIGGFPIDSFEQLLVEFNHSNEKDFVKKLNRFIEEKNINQILCEHIKNNFGKIIFGGTELDDLFKRKFTNKEEAFVNFLFKNFDLTRGNKVEL